MRTTLNVSDPIMRRLKETAMRQHRTMSEIVESASLFFFAASVASASNWEGTDQNNRPVSSGVYFFRLVADDKTIDTKRMLLLK